MRSRAADGRRSDDTRFRLGERTTTADPQSAIRSDAEALQSRRASDARRVQLIMRSDRMDVQRGDLHPAPPELVET